MVYGYQWLSWDLKEAKWVKITHICIKYQTFGLDARDNSSGIAVQFATQLRASATK